MNWIAPSEKDTANGTLEKKLWEAADQFRANPCLQSREYSAPVLGLIFLRFTARPTKLEKTRASSRRVSRVDQSAAYHAEGILYLLSEAPPMRTKLEIAAVIEGWKAINSDYS